MKRKEGFPGQISYVLPESVQETIKKSPLISDLYMTDIGYYPNAKHHYRKREKGIDQAILIYCTEGRGTVSIENKKHALEKDEYIIIPPGKAHYYFSDTKVPWSIFWIHFTGPKAYQFKAYTNACIPIDRNEYSRINSRLELFEEIFRNLERGFAMEILEYVNLSLQYLLASFTHIEQFRLINKVKDNDPVSRSINYMLENITHGIELSKLAALVHLSASHFSRLFVKKTGQSPMNYYKQIRIQKACNLLDISNLSIADVAREIGFKNPFYFSRAFKSVMGVSPSKFRKSI